MLPAENMKLPEVSVSSSESEINEATDTRPVIVVIRRKRDRKSKNSSYISSDDTIITNLAGLCGSTIIIKSNDLSKRLTKIDPLCLKEHLESVASDSVIQNRPNPPLNFLTLDTRNSESTKALLTVTLLGSISVTACEHGSPGKAQSGVFLFNTCPNSQRHRLFTKYFR